MGVVTHFVYSWIRGNGGEPMTPNEEVTRSQWATDPETVNTVQWLTDLSHKQGLMPVKTTGGVWGTFREGKVAIGVMETNNLYQIVEAQQQTGNQFRWDVHPLPAMKKGRYQPINGFSYGVSRNTRTRTPPGSCSSRCWARRGRRTGTAWPASPPASSPS